MIYGTSPTYRTAYAAPRSFHAPKHRELWKGCRGAWFPGLGRTRADSIRDQTTLANDATLPFVTPSLNWALVDGIIAGSCDTSGINMGTHDITGYSAITITWWMAGFATTNNNRFVSLKYAGSDDFRCWINSGNITVTFDDGSAVNVNGGSNFDSSTMNHYGMMYDGNGTISYWYNGKQIASASDTPSFGSASGEFRFGGTTVGGAGQGGEYDDMRLYNRRLTPGEFRLLASRRGVAYEPYIPFGAAFEPVAGAAPSTRLPQLALLGVG